MATPCEEEAIEVEQNPGESPKMSDLKVVINGKNNEYMTINIFRAIFQSFNHSIIHSHGLCNASGKFGVCRSSLSKLVLDSPPQHL